MPPALEPEGLAADDPYERLAAATNFEAPLGPILLRLVDALLAGEFKEFAAQALRARVALEGEGLGHEACRLVAGLGVHRAEGILGSIYCRDVTELRTSVRAQAAQAKAEGAFPWHLLDG